jgi:DNA (cytosine-5)-methyltransferase 1
MLKSWAYYNEFDSKAAVWLRELIKGGHIANGDVDTRSIEEVTPADLTGYTQCHFFAGIGGWSLALRLAGWPDDKPVWTGSCPCQPFSAAGKGKGFADERHLWPAWDWLIGQCRPDIIFGEQVANSGDWIDLVSTDLEGKGYAFGAAVLGAHSVGAPHIRQRLYWMADADQGQRGRIADGEERERNGTATGRLQGDSQFESSGAIGGLGDADEPRPQGRSRPECSEQRSDGQIIPRSAWDFEFIECRDGKRRPTEPGIFPLAHGVPGRVGLLRGYGNAIVPQVAATFISASGRGYNEN